MKIPFISFLLFTLLFSSLTICSARDSIVTAEGYGGDRADALLAAKREAVAQGIGMLLISETEINNFTLKRDMVLTKTMGSIRRLTILEEKKEAGDVYFVRIRAVVSEESIKKDLMALQVLLSSMDYPRILVILNNDPNNTGTVTISDYFVSREVPVVEPPILMQAGAGSGRETSYSDRYSPMAMARLGKQSGADYVLLGSVEVNQVQSDFMMQTGLQSYRAVIPCKIISCRSGRVIASKSASAAAAHISAGSAREMAIEKAANRLMDEKLFDQLIGSFQNAVNNGFPLYVKVLNVSSYSMQKKIRKLIEGLDTRSLHRKNYADGNLDLEVVYNSNSEKFCDAVDGKMLAGSRLIVTECGGDKVVVRTVRPAEKQGA